VQGALTTTVAAVMDLWNVDTTLFSFVSLLLALILDASDNVHAIVASRNAVSGNIARALNLYCSFSPILNTFSLFSSTVNNYCLCCIEHPLSHDVAYWVKPRFIA